MPALGLFGSVPEDYLRFGRGESFDPKLVSCVLKIVEN